MKTLNILLIWLVILSFFACKKMNNEDATPVASQDKTTTSSTSTSPTTNNTVCGGKTHHDMMAGQYTKMGDVVVFNTKDKLFVEYTTNSDWYIAETHLYVGPLSAMPATPTGNPKLGNFPYNDEHAGVQRFVYEIPTKDMPLCFDIVAHASVYRKDGAGNIVQTETAYAKGNQINEKGSWAMYFNYCLQECGCDYKTFNADMFGGQTIPVGTLHITNDETNLYVTYFMAENWFLSETHLYVGAISGMPVNKSNTPIPGKFPYSMTHNNGTTQFMYTIPLNNLPACYAIAAHASVYKMDNGNVVQTETSWSAGTEFSGTNRWGSYTSYCTQICN